MAPPAPDFTPKPLEPSHTGASAHSVHSTTSAGHQAPVLSRRNSVSANVIDTTTIGTPAPKEVGRPRMHKRSLTGTYFPSTPGGTGATDASTWPIGDEQTWKEAMKADEDNSVKQVVGHVVHHVTTTLARQAFNVDDISMYNASALAVRDEMLKKWNDTTAWHTMRAPKRVYYFSLEFLMGRSLDNAVLNLGHKELYQEALGKLGFSFEDLLEEERDAGLGNGGLGRLAACYIDSCATLGIPAWGYGLRYQYGIFKQLLDQHGSQLEMPDPYLNQEYPWEIARNDVKYSVRFYGTCDSRPGKGKAVWYGGQECLAVAYDVPVPGWKTENCASLRLWKAAPAIGFDLQSFNAGNYQASVDASNQAETITRVLYPNDNTNQGKELRLKQQYLWCCASLQDILRRFKKLDLPWKALPDMVAIQLNDSHPTIAIPELMRILIDEEELEWDEAWSITIKIFNYTNHTVLPEALEKWSVDLMRNLLPRHLSIIYLINQEHLNKVAEKWPKNIEKLRSLSIIEEGSPQVVRMAHLAVIGSAKVNGVAEIHSGLVKTVLFPDFVALMGPDKFTNVTNGITPRRWIHQANPDLSKLITSCVGSDDWLKDLSLIRGLEQYIDNEDVVNAFHQIKVANKKRLAEVIERELGIPLDATAMFTVQAKRLHEYKRQSLNILGCIYRYLMIKETPAAERKKWTPHVSIFAGKAAPGYYIAKLIIQLINNVAKVVNNDPEIGDLLKVVFIPDYSVSVAEVLMPAADVSVQISTAGTEASGTGNMKLSINGALMLGTVDGANVEIVEETGEENSFLFGYLAPQVDDVRYQNSYQAAPIQQRSPEISVAIAAVQNGTFGPNVYQPFLDTIIHHDHYLVSNDFGSYLEAEKLADELFATNHREWIRKSMIVVARMGKFSSDRAVQEYADEIWSVEPEIVPPNSSSLF